MKKIVLFLVLLLVFPYESEGNTHSLKLRTSRHRDFLRIVLEGERPVIRKAMVFQKGQSVLVNIPDINFTLTQEKITVVYGMADRNTVVFYPGEFRGLKVSTLKHPDRLVIDVYLKEKDRLLPPPVVLPEEKQKNIPEKIDSVVIDPGHGGYDMGIIQEEYREKNVVLDIARKLKVLVDKSGSSGILTRGSDRYMSQHERVEAANRKDADVFISLHIGKHEETVIYLPVVTERYPGIVEQYLAGRGQKEYLDETVTLLNAVKEAVMSSFGEDMVSVQPLPYSMLSGIEAAALMIELPSFDDAYYIEELNEEMANIIYKGLYMYEEKRSR